MGGKALPIRLIKFLIIHLHSRPAYLRLRTFPMSLSRSHSLARFFLRGTSLSPILLPLSPGPSSVPLFLCALLFHRRGRDPFNIFLNYIFNGRNK